MQVMSSLAMVVNAFEGHAVHELACEKATNGFDMKEPIGQQPKRPVDVKPLSLPGWDCHLPPHNVRLKPLL